jgi:hypothetical protein
MVRSILLVALLCLSTTVVAQNTQPAGDWVNWDEVEQRYSTKELEKITDPEARAAAESFAAEAGTARTDALSDFKKGAGLGLSVAVGSEQNSIEEARVVNKEIVVTRRSKDQPRAALEIHQLFTTNVLTEKGRKAAREQIRACEVDPVNCPMFGVGPFAAIQIGGDDAINSIGLGLMFGFRSDPRQDSSFNIGIGITADSRVKRLAPGFVEGGALPADETEVRFTEKSSRRLLVTLSFAF